MQQFHRNFDIGVSQKDHPEIFAAVSSEAEGKKMVSQTIAHFRAIGKAYLIPHYIVMCGCRFLGYKLVMNYRKLPKGLLPKLSMNETYWRNYNGT